MQHRPRSWGGYCLGTLLPSALMGLVNPFCPAVAPVCRALLSLLLTHQAEVSELN